MDEMAESSARRRLSIVVPCYNEAPALDALFDRLDGALLRLPGLETEIVCIDDGSTDGTLGVLRARAARDPRLIVLELSRNFGKEAALTAGLDAATGDAVVPMDADLQHPAELIEVLVARWRDGYDVVLARRRSRSGESWLGRHGSQGFYSLHNRLSHIQIPRDVGDFRLIDRVVVDALKRLPERRRFMKGLFAWVGFRSTVVDYEVEPRVVGHSTFNLHRMWALALDGIASFSTVPLTLWTWVGSVVASLSFLYGSWIVLRTVLFGVDVPGFASLLTAVLFMGGVQILSIGVLGEYVGRVYDEAKQRPVYVVRRRYVGSESSADA